MRMNRRTLHAAVFCSMLLMVAAGCKKKAPAPPPPKPQAARINSFTVEPQTIERGQPATLSWSVANATDISIDQGLGAVAANGTRQVFPANTITYSMTARSGGGMDMRSVTV